MEEGAVCEFTGSGDPRTSWRGSFRPDDHPLGAALRAAASRTAARGRSGPGTAVVPGPTARVHRGTGPHRGRGGRAVALSQPGPGRWGRLRGGRGEHHEWAAVQLSQRRFLEDAAVICGCACGTAPSRTSSGRRGWWRASRTAVERRGGTCETSAATRTDTAGLYAAGPAGHRRPRGPRGDPGLRRADPHRRVRGWPPAAPPASASVRFPFRWSGTAPGTTSKAPPWLVHWLPRPPGSYSTSIPKSRTSSSSPPV